jgi:hypothetical protein
MRGKNFSYLNSDSQLVIRMMKVAIRMLKLLASPLLQNTQTPGPGQDIEMLVWSRAFRPAQDGTLVNASKKIPQTGVGGESNRAPHFSRSLREVGILLEPDR